LTVGQQDAKTTKRAAGTTRRRVSRIDPSATVEVPLADLERLLRLAEAARDGDRRSRVPSFGSGIVGEIADALGDAIARNRHVAREMARTRRVVGRGGRLGGRLDPGECTGTLADLVDNANGLIEEIASPIEDIGRTVSALVTGQFDERVDIERAGVPPRGDIARVARNVNRLGTRLSSFDREITRVVNAICHEGVFGGRIRVRGIEGDWRELSDTVNNGVALLGAQLRDLLRTTSSIASGDLSQKITVESDGDMLRLKHTMNVMVDQLATFSSEVTRVTRELGVEGRFGGQAEVPGAVGVWRDLTDAVNSTARNVSAQVRDIAQVTTAVANGDLSQKITVEVAGEMLRLKNTVNTMVDQLSAFSHEVTRVAREVGDDGRLGGRADVPGVAGTWKDLTDSVNSMAFNLTSQLRNIAQVATAVARGDLRAKIEVKASGEVLELKEAINTMVDQLSAFADEVTRVAREVGTDGRLGGQAMVPGVAGTWRDLTDNVNSMANNLTNQVRNIAQVTTAVARGDLSQKITVEARGEILELKETVNTMVDQLSAFADEVTRVALEVGTEGSLGGQATVPGAAGTWRDLTESVNVMAKNLTNQVREIAQVATAVAGGDLSRKITVDASGEVLQLKQTINTMVDQLSAFADEVTRVAREVGTDGRLGGQAQVPGVAGTWRDLTDNVNFMANNLTSQVRNIAQVTTAVAQGDLSQKITVDARGEILQLKETVNTMVDQLSAFADEVTRVAREVGTEGKLGGQATVRGVAGIWKDLTDNVNVMGANLTSQVREIATVATAVARGDLSRKIGVEAQGEVAALADTINTMVDQLSAFADEVTRVAREVGTDGRLGGQATVPGVSGIWKDLTDNVNSMAGNLTSQVRNIALVTTAVANGDLSKHIDVDASGEILELKTTINTMVDQLSAFADEVTRVAREVGTEGKLGGQATVEGASGTWQRLTESVNQLAGNLTTQVRAIAEVATAVTRGDLTRHITVDAPGEVGELKDNINQMIGNLRATTERNEEQDWLKSNLTRISALMQGKRDPLAVAKLIMTELTPVVSAQQGAFYLVQPNSTDPDRNVLRFIAGYGNRDDGTLPREIEFGESLIGEAAAQKKPILVNEVPKDYVRISSGLGSATPTSVIVLPVLFEDRVLAVVELASLQTFNPMHLTLLGQIIEAVGVIVNTILANSRTESLLTESQRLTVELKERSDELQSQQEELRRSNAELEDKAALLARQNRDIEVKNYEIEQARQALEDRAEQLALSSRYKSEFLANMSHELRTPLNSLLILARLLADNPGKNLTAKQVEFAETIHSAGSDLLQLINDILDLSKIEAGRMDVQPARIALSQLVEYVEATFQPMTQERGLEFVIHVDSSLPSALRTDEQRLQQVLRNLLSNAVKFTETGGVELRVTREADVMRSDPESPAIKDAIAFSVIDTGIGISEDKLRVIFEAFQQADGTTSRRFGGTGLGLSISREIARLLRGSIHVESRLGRGSTFTLYLPLVPDEDVPPRVPEQRAAIEGAALGVFEAGGEPAGTSGGRLAPEAEPLDGTAIDTLAIDGVSRRGEDCAVLPEDADAARADVPERFDGEAILIVDDDVRNVFALTSVLEQHNLSVLYAANGREGIEVLESADNVSLILMDIMMPEMDGYATMRAIRAMPRFSELPIIALTAKAMREDREKSIAAGASDYITKPVDVDHLLTLIRNWLTADSR
jgi:HAMP domain-containing protein/signal transduction histidine kinase/ActR/RegA family two-component response regulator